jgi:hypothetical protein
MKNTIKNSLFLATALLVIAGVSYAVDFIGSQREPQGEAGEKPHLCFHCLRVTYVTRLAQAGVPLSLAMRLTNHSDELVHRIYQRLGVEDVRQYANVMAQSLASVSATKQSRQAKHDLRISGSPSSSQSELHDRNPNRTLSRVPSKLAPRR